MQHKKEVTGVNAFIEIPRLPPTLHHTEDYCGGEKTEEELTELYYVGWKTLIPTEMPTEK